MHTITYYYIITLHKRVVRYTLSKGVEPLI